MLEFQHVTKKQGKFVLSDINFRLEEGFLLGIVGKNGAGKTTLMRCMLEEKAAYTGNIFFQGQNIKNSRREFMTKCAYVADNNIFLRKKTALDNVDILGGFYSEFDREKFEKYMKEVDVSTQKKIENMSRGEFIRFQIAFARARNARLYLLDEATAGMDPVFRKDFYRILRDILSKEATVLMTTHILEDINKNMDYVCRIEQGRMVYYEENMGDMEITGGIMHEQTEWKRSTGISKRI